MAKREVVFQSLGARERQIVEIIYRLQKASVAEVREHIENPPSYSSVRTMMGLLESKGILKRQLEGIRYVYRPAKPRSIASRSALKHLVSTFFDGSSSAAIAALVNESAGNLSEDELNDLQALIDRVRSEEKK